MLSYESEEELSYGIPKNIGEIYSNPLDPSEIIEDLFIKANFSGVNGTIWIRTEIEEIIWEGYLDEIIDTQVDDVYLNYKVSPFFLFTN